MATTATSPKKPTAPSQPTPATPAVLTVLRVERAVGPAGQLATQVLVSGEPAPRRPGYVNPALDALVASIGRRAGELLGQDESSVEVAGLAKELAAVQGEALLAEAELGTAKAKLRAAQLSPLPDAGLQQKRLADL